MTKRSRRRKKRLSAEKRILGSILLLIMILGTGFVGWQQTEKDSKGAAKEVTQFLTDIRDTVIQLVTKQEDKTNSSNSQLKMHVIDVGQADCILIESNHKFMLVDGGNDDDKDIVFQYLKDHGVKRLEYVIATHPHEDHIGGLDDVIDEFEVGSVYAPKIEHTTKTYYNFLESVQNKGLKIRQPKVLETKKLADCTITFLSPVKDYKDNLNNWSVGFKITNETHTFLMYGDAEVPAEKDMMQTKVSLDADVLKVSHHGSDTSSDLDFLKKVSPKIAVISCGAGNKYGHPNKTTLDKLNTLHVKTYRTDLDKTIVVESDGTKLLVHTGSDT